MNMEKLFRKELHDHQIQTQKLRTEDKIINSWAASAIDQLK